MYLVYKVFLRASESNQLYFCRNQFHAVLQNEIVIAMDINDAHVVLPRNQRNEQ